MLGQLQPGLKGRCLRACLDDLCGEIADKFRDVFRVCGFLPDFARTFPRRLPRIPQSIERVYIYAIGLFYTLSFDLSFKNASANVGAYCAWINPESFRGNLCGHPPGITRAISACALLSHAGILNH